MVSYDTDLQPEAEFIDSGNMKTEGLQIKHLAEKSAKQS
jgi:hypothetical protein